MLIPDSLGTRTAVVALLVFTTLAPTGGSAMTYYVSTQGNDAWSGTIPGPDLQGTDGPFRSLTRARDALREVPHGEDRRVVVREGTYYLDTPLRLDPQDSGTAASPTTFEALQGERVVLSGGRAITGWRRKEGDVWAAPIPEPLRSGPGFRQLRVGDDMQILARHPDFDSEDPLKKGWLFARQTTDGTQAWTTTMARIHTPGDRIAWDVEIPADGVYAVWLYYGQLMKPHGRTDMDGRTAVTVDSGPDVPLLNLPDTGSWSTFRWTRCAQLGLTAGKHRITWHNRGGGGINFNAFALCTDPGWVPRETPPEQPSPGTSLVVVQAEDYVEAKGRELGIDRGAYAGKPDEIPFRRGDIPTGDVAGGQVTIFPAWGWVGGPVQVASIDQDACILRLTGPNASQDVRLGNRYCLQNVRFALDRPGEFFPDMGAGELLYIPELPGSVTQEVVAPFLDRIVEITGDSEQDLWVEHVQFEGFSFRDARYSIAVDSMYSPDDAAIRIGGARDITVERCTFSHLGGYAVRLADRASRCRVLACDIREMGQGGVIARGDSATQPTDCTVGGCRMQDLGRVYKHVAGVYVTTGSRFLVTQNTIHDVPRYAISFKSFGEGSASHGCVAEYNDIRRTNLETNDTGAIETLGRDRKPTGNIIRYNMILDTVGMKHTPGGDLLTPYYTWGIYLDDYSSGTTVRGNIVARNVRGGYHNHLGFDNVVDNNVFIDGQAYQAEWNGGAQMRRNTFTRNIVVYSEPTAVYIRSSGWDPAVLAECDYNVVWWRTGDVAEITTAVTPAGPWAKWQELGFDTHSILADPLFVNAEADDYRLTPDSPALKLGFVPIPVDKIGADAYPSYLQDAR